MRVQIRDLLKGIGFKKVVLAESVSSAKDMLEAGPVHLILCDWHMEPVDGLEFLRYVRVHPGHSAVAFVMITAESTKERVIEAIASGLDDYIVKPLTAQIIQTRVKAVLQKKRVIE
jgi:two-component system chemotaxis response regulator CheY